MSEQLKWNINLQVIHGPTLSLAGDLSIDAYDKISVDVAHDAPAVTIDVQPGDSGEVLFLLVRSDRYGAGLTYKVNGTGAAVVIDQPQFFLGVGAMSLFSDAPKTIEVENKLASSEDAKLEILVGRTAVPT